MSRSSGMLKWLVASLILVVIVGVAVWFYLTPYLALYNMRAAAERRDAATFSSYIDFPVFKENFKAELNARMASELGKTQQKDNPLANLGMLLATNLVNGMVDAFVSPAGVERLMGGDFLPPDPTKKNPQDGTAKNGFANEETHNIAYGYDSFNDFSVTMTPKANPTGGIKLMFQRRGLFGWQLINLKMP